MFNSTNVSFEFFPLQNPCYWFVYISCAVIPLKRRHILLLILVSYYELCCSSMTNLLYLVDSYVPGWFVFLHFLKIQISGVTLFLHLALHLLCLICWYCKTLYFRCILISRFWNVEILLHFNLTFSQCSTSIYQAFDRQTEFSRVFNFTILSYSWNSRNAKNVFYSSYCSVA